MSQTLQRAGRFGRVCDCEADERSWADGLQRVLRRNASKAGRARARVHLGTCKSLRNWLKRLSYARGSTGKVEPEALWSPGTNRNNCREYRSNPDSQFPPEVRENRA